MEFFKFSLYIMMQRKEVSISPQITHYVLAGHVLATPDLHYEHRFEAQFSGFFEN